MPPPFKLREPSSDRRHIRMLVWQDIGMWIKFILCSGSVLAAIAPYGQLLHCEAVQSGNVLVSSDYIVSQCTLPDHELELMLPVFMYGATYILNAVMFVGIIALNKLLWFKEHARYIAATLILLLIIMASVKIILVLSLEWTSVPNFKCEHDIDGSYNLVEYSGECSSKIISIPPFTNTSYVDCKDHCSITLPQSIYPLLGTIVLSFIYVTYLVIEYAWLSNKELLRLEKSVKVQLKETGETTEENELQTQRTRSLVVSNRKHSNIENGLYEEPLLPDSDPSQTEDIDTGVETRNRHRKCAWIFSVLSASRLKRIMGFARVMQDSSALGKFILTALSILSIIGRPNTSGIINCKPVTTSPQSGYTLFTAAEVKAWCKPSTYAQLSASIFGAIVVFSSLLFAAGILFNSVRWLAMRARKVAPAMIIAAIALLFCKLVALLYLPYLDIIFDCNAPNIPANLRHKCLDWMPPKFMGTSGAQSCTEYCSVSISIEFWCLLPSLTIAYVYLLFLIVESVKRGDSIHERMDSQENKV